MVRFSVSCNGSFSLMLSGIGAERSPYFFAPTLSKPVLASNKPLPNPDPQNPPFGGRFVA